VASRKGWPVGTVGDTVSIIPYHFNLLGAASERDKPLRDFLADASQLKQMVPGQPRNDTYGDGQIYRDGHDWRNAMMQTLDWMKKEDISVQNAIIVVLDWNDLAQAPQHTANGVNKAGASKYLTLPQNAARWQAFNKIMQSNGIAPKNLETVQVGNLEYDMAVFAVNHVQPIGSVLTSTPTASPTSTVAPTPIVTPTPPQKDGKLKLDGMVPAILLLVILLVAGAFVAFRGFAMQGLKVNDKNFAMRAFGPTATLAILGIQGRPKAGQLSCVLPESAVPHGPSGTLATIQVNLMGKVQVSKGAYQVKASQGFKALPNGGAEMIATKGTFELRDSSDQLVTLINVRRQ
jgi:hypothetical protein